MKRAFAVFVLGTLWSAHAAIAAPPEGFYDPTFATGGAITLAFERPPATPLAEFGVAVGRTSKGSILVAGQCNGATAAVCVARLTEDGVVDVTFGIAGDGLAYLVHPTFVATDMAVHADDSITLCGYLSGEPATLRLASTGVFLNSEPVIFLFGAGLASPDSLRCTAALNGKTYVGGAVARQTSGRDFALARVDGLGALDPGFSGDGRAILTRTPTLADQEVFGDLAAIPSGGVVMVGNVFPQVTPIDSESAGWEICALTESGDPRIGFGTSGCKAFQVSASTLEYEAFAVAVDSEQRIVVAGTTTTLGVIYNYAVGRFLLDGNRDASFNFGDVQTIATTVADVGFAPRGIGVDALGKPIVAGQREVLGQRQLLVLRVLADGSGRDPTFGNDGESLLAAGANSHSFGGLVLDRDRPVVLGSTVNGGNPVDFFVARLQTYLLFADGFEE